MTNCLRLLRSRSRHGAIWVRLKKGARQGEAAAAGGVAAAVAAVDAAAGHRLDRLPIGRSGGLGCTRGGRGRGRQLGQLDVERLGYALTG